MSQFAAPQFLLGHVPTALAFIVLAYLLMLAVALASVQMKVDRLCRPRITAATHEKGSLRRGKPRPRQAPSPKLLEEGSGATQQPQQQPSEKRRSGKRYVKKLANAWFSISGDEGPEPEEVAPYELEDSVWILPTQLAAGGDLSEPFELDDEFWRNPAIAA